MSINNQLYVTWTMCFQTLMKNYLHPTAIRSCFLSGAKVKLLTSLIFILTSFSFGFAQTYTVQYTSGNDSLSTEQKKFVQTSFASRNEASQYIFELPSTLHTKGFITASVDNVVYDSLSARVNLYFGEQYKWAQIHTAPEDQDLLQSIRFPEDLFKGQVDFTTLQLWQQRILDHLEENGYPFGKVYLDSIIMKKGEINGRLKIEKGPIYHIDSIRVYGDVNIKNEFLQRYLQISNGSIYNKKRLQAVSKRLAEISYIQEVRSSDLSLLATGSVLNLYLKPKKSSQANVLIGFLPNSDQLSAGKKLLLTVDANILLRNALGSGETIGLVWQQLQQKSPRLNLIFEQPYIFRSPFGFNFTLDMYKRDSTFLNINMNLGTSYRIEERQTFNIFLQRRQSIISGINTNAIIQNKQLPRDGDVSSINLGLGYTFNNTDFRFNPGRGNDFVITGSAGTKKIRKNNQILDLEDPADPSFDFESLYDTVKLKAYQFRITTAYAHFFPLGGISTMKFGVNGGIYQSASYYRNELFQIGGIKLLRGFDEESQFVSKYGIGTIEYRLRAGSNSFFYGFVDGGWGSHILETNPGHTYFGTGIGLSFETRSSVINLAWAIGKRDDTELNLRQSKVHLGFASFF